MRKRTGKRATRQGEDGAAIAGGRVGQMLLPMLAGIAATKKEFTSWVHEVGLLALRELLDGDAERMAGPKGRHQRERTHHHWGTANSPLAFAGRHISIKRPRVRRRGGGEAELPLLRQFQEQDPLPERVVNQILLGVSTRGYEKSIEPAPAGVRSRGASRSAASRHLVARTSATMRSHLARRLDDLDVLVLMLDGLVVAEHTVVAALGITVDGTKIPLGLWLGSTENTTICTELLQDLLNRGLRVTGRLLCVIDGGKGVRKAVTDVFGDLAVIQRCQIHKRRNIRDHLSEKRRAYVARALNDAYKSDTVDTARKRLRSLASWLERNGEDGAAASLREGLEETLTVLKLGLPPTLRRTLATTNPIENMNGTVRRVTRNVKRWRGGAMVRRWTALAMLTAQKRFRRIKGHRDLPVLLRALRGRESRLDQQKEAA